MAEQQQSGKGGKIERAIADDLIRAIYKREGWTRGDRDGFNSQAARCSAIYDITADPARNRYVAVRKACAKVTSA